VKRVIQVRPVTEEFGQIPSQMVDVFVILSPGVDQNRPTGKFQKGRGALPDVNVVGKHIRPFGVRPGIGEYEDGECACQPSPQFATIHGIPSNVWRRLKVVSCSVDGKGQTWSRGQQRCLVRECAAERSPICKITVCAKSPPTFV